MTENVRKALQQLRTPKPDAEQSPTNKRPMEAKDAKEMAKKLIKSGAIRVPEKLPSNNERTTFKRSMGLERKLSAADKAPSGYQPFSTSHPEEEVHESRLKVKHLYDSFVSDRERVGEKAEGRAAAAGGLEGEDPLSPLTPPRAGTAPGGALRPPLSGDAGVAPRSGHTIYIFGYNISEEVIKKNFSSFGSIINISMEVDNNCGFVTFEKVESAEKAIAEMNGTMVSGVQLKVSLARRQPPVEPINDASSSATWSTIGTWHALLSSCLIIIMSDKRTV
ncbi:hypothetical protein HAZT_HAZT007064 [Hyalella azteca]|uniref:Negative elongation factor E n=1 Tax=Hyalella azteca TaxID=294128 RepID=A0A6A0GX06_HYAAZ|nr:hypothetical protein HAZT_HAZT007064 [Hyalella azteca]